jgi:cytochrome P450
LAKTSPQMPDTEIGRAVLRALLKERSPLGPLRVMFERLGPFFQIPLAGFRPFVVAGPQAVRKVLVTERGKVRWRNQDPVTDLLRQGVLVVDGEKHDEVRSLMERPIAPGALDQYVAMMGRQTERVMATWQPGQKVDMLVEGRKIALLIIMEALFSVDFWDDLPRLWTPILKAIEYISPGPWILWRKIPRLGYKLQIESLNRYLYGIISGRRASLVTHHDLLQHLLDAGLDDDRIRDQMLTMLIAGHDTSTALLAWTFALLGQHPEIYRRLQHELDESLAGQPPSAPGGWQPHLLDEVIKEALRLYPPIHIGNRMVAEPLEFEGGCIPAGERLFYSIYLTHRDPANWQNPHDFQPERFSHGRKQPPFAYVPFGGGPRACIGAAFGQAEARIVIARLLQAFDFTLLEPNIHAHMGATLEPRPGVLMRVQPRHV